MISKTLSRSLAIAATTAAFGLASHGALAANSVGGTASANILSAIVLTNPTALNFGNILPGATTGTVVVPLSGAASATGGATLIGGAVLSAWNVTGTSGQPLVLTIDASDAVTGPGPSMTFDTFTNNAPTTFTSGSVNFNVGATLHVGTAALQTAGPYSGTYTVTVNY